MQQYQLILRALMVTLSKPNMQHELGYIATSLQNAINWSEQGGFEPQMRQEFANAFVNSAVLSS